MMNRTSWKEIILGTLAGLSLLTSPAIGKMSSSAEELTVRMDNRRPGSLNSGHDSLNGGPGSQYSGHSDRNEGDHSGRHGQDSVAIAQAGDDIRQEDRRADRREDRRLDRREDRQTDRREDHRSNAGGELRGLDRADHVAGGHGREGRENARMMQMERPHRPERMERIERPERPEHSERPERPERSGRN